jgi:uroporphyrin-III C-methyltransferase / precorrin-2 dehydrogenase / sirohydrochlorin ferrochelatase
MSEHSHPSASSWFPVFLNLSGRRVLVIGGDEVALRKIRRLHSAGAVIDLVAESLHPEIAELHDSKRLNWLGATIANEHLGGHALIVIASADAFTRDRIRAWGEKQGVPVNVVDRLAESSAIVPAVVDRSPLMIAIGSGGQAPELARMIRSRIEKLLPPSIGRLASIAGSLAGQIRSRFPELARRRRFLDWVFTGLPADEVAAGREDHCRELVTRALDKEDWSGPGHVSLVGAGPGEPELLTLRALSRIQAADVIVHDGLVDARILDYARRDAELIDVAKRPGENGVGQDGIHEILVEHARAGARVVRLKGGDPMVFGRGGEELAFLRAHGIAYEVVPGVTAASACAAYAGLPLTQRGMAQSVRLVTAHCERSIDRLDWAALAADHQTLAFYMSVGQLERIEHQLMAHGRSPGTPVALVENGTRPDQRVAVGELRGLAALAREHAISSPSMLFVGEVAALARELGWYGDALLTRQAQTAPAVAVAG